APAGDLLWLRRNLRFSGRPESKQRVAPEPPAPRRARGSLRCAELEARAKLPPLRSGQTVARSQSLKRAGARDLKFLALLGGTQRGSEGTARTSGVGALGIRLFGCWLFGAPL